MEIPGLDALTVVGVGPEVNGGDKVTDRLRNFAGGVAYCGVFAVAIGVLTSSGSNESRQPSRTAAGVFSWPAGRWLVGVAGGVLIVVCAVQACEALQKKFLGDNKTEQMGTIPATGSVSSVDRARVASLVCRPDRSRSHPVCDLFLAAARYQRL